MEIKDIIVDAVKQLMSLEAASAIEGYDDFLDTALHQQIVYSDIICQHIQDWQKTLGVSDLDAYIFAKNIWDQIVSNLDDCIVLEKSRTEINPDSCKKCPAYEWVVHREGKHLCRLGFEIEETVAKDGFLSKPLNGCIRPDNVGGAYLVARAIHRETPIVGKLCKEEYDMYLAEKESLGL